MKKIRELFITEHFKQVGYIDGMKWIRVSTGKVVPQNVVDYFIETGGLDEHK